ncbi:MAG: FAD-dependent oxidoreductase [Clostridia bacterium]|nr:FAD-dependent oxidoreductase [Clostridia bacterium]
MADKVNLIIDGKPCVAEKGQTILSVAAANGIDIPTLCFMKEYAPYGACGVCVVEAENMPKLLRACSATVSEGMVIHTDSEKVRKVRDIAFELIMSDHDGDCLGPCRINCPAHTDCQKYVRQIAEGDFAGAVSTIREKIPLPASIGRVCPHPCETACRRQKVEEPVSIAFLKAFAADEIYKTNTDVIPEKAATTGKTVGIIGGGPAGLTAAYYLALSGHAVTVYDKMPKMGGMLRYGIPEYRLPKAILDREIEEIEKLGVTLVNNFTIGKDASFAALRTKHDALLVANGAWKSSALRCEGEHLDGVFGGIDFLRAVALGEKPAIGKKTAIVGGGNTAMDACRTAVRLGAEEVSIIYRRTKAEMPAEDIEIKEAEEEGVVFRFLTNPAEVLGANGKVTGVKLQVMQLGEPDERGRRAPVPVEGEFVTLDLDSLIVAVGQKNDPTGFEDLPVTKWGTILADDKTGLTSLDGVFAVGDATNKGASIAIQAIAEAGRAAKAIDAYLCGYDWNYKEPVLSVRKEEVLDFSDREKQARAVMPHRSAQERKHDFKEVNLGFSPEQAMAEAKRCLECGCHDYGHCRLIHYADKFDINCKKMDGEYHPCFTEERLVSIERNQNKCILCNNCVRACAATGKELLGLVGRGFTTVIRPETRDESIVAQCADCLQCVYACPTGALRILKK